MPMSCAIFNKTSFIVIIGISDIQLNVPIKLSFYVKFICVDHNLENISAKQWQRKISKLPLLHEVVWQACSVCLLCNLKVHQVIFSTWKKDRLVLWRNMFTMTYSPINDISGLKTNLFWITDSMVAAMLSSYDKTNTLSIVESIHYGWKIQLQTEFLKLKMA